MQQKTPIRKDTNFTNFHKLNSGCFVSIVPMRPQETQVALSMNRPTPSQCIRKKTKGALHEPQGAAGILPAARWRRRFIWSRFLEPALGLKAMKVISPPAWAHAPAETPSDH